MIKKVLPGESFNFKANDWNQLADAANKMRFAETNQSVKSAVKARNGYQTVTVVNTGDSIIHMGSVVHLEVLKYYRGLSENLDVVFSATIPDGSKDEFLGVIVEKSLRTNEVGNAAISGVVPVITGGTLIPVSTEHIGFPCWARWYNPEADGGKRSDGFLTPSLKGNIDGRIMIITDSRAASYYPQVDYPQALAVLPAKFPENDAFYGKFGAMYSKKHNKFIVGILPTYPNNRDVYSGYYNDMFPYNKTFEEEVLANYWIESGYAVSPSAFKCTVIVNGKSIEVNNALLTPKTNISPAVATYIVLIVMAAGSTENEKIDNLENDIFNAEFQLSSNYLAPRYGVTIPLARVNINRNVYDGVSSFTTDMLIDTRLPHFFATVPHWRADSCCTRLMKEQLDGINQKITTVNKRITSLH